MDQGRCLSNNCLRYQDFVRQVAEAANFALLHKIEVKTDSVLRQQVKTRQLEPYNKLLRECQCCHCAHKCQPCLTPVHMRRALHLAKVILALQNERGEIPGTYLLHRQVKKWRAIRDSTILAQVPR